jgi:cytochrome c556
MHTLLAAVTFAAGALLAVSIAGAAQRESEPTTVRELMLTVTIPASDVIFSAQAEPPATPDGWRAVEQAARTLAESGHALKRPPLAKPEKEWPELADAMVAQAVRAGAAAAKRDADAVSETADALFESCDNCHDRYIGGVR